MTLAKFQLGHLVATPAALSTLSLQDLTAALARHLQGDWGELDTADRAANDRAIRGGSRLASAFRAANGTRFWIITEWDRSVTTILLPEDY